MAGEEELPPLNPERYVVQLACGHTVHRTYPPFGEVTTCTECCSMQPIASVTDTEMAG